MPSVRFFVSRIVYASATAAALVGPGFSSAQQLDEAPPFVPPPLLGDDLPSAEAESSILSPTASDEPQRETLPTPEPAPASPADRLRATVREQHPWARLEPGAWRKIHVLSEAFDAEGVFVGRSLTERLERLTAVDDRSYTLEVETTVELAGRRTTGPSETQYLDLLTDSPVGESSLRVSEEETASVSRGDVVASCTVWQIEAPQESGGSTLRLYVAEDEVPTVMRRERSDVATGQTAAIEWVESVTHGGVPAEYGGALVETWTTTQTRTEPTGGRGERSGVYALEPPGGLLSESVAEYNAQGARSRWAVTRLIESGRTPEERIVTDAALEPEAAKPIEIRPRRLLKLLRRGELTEPEL